MEKVQRKPGMMTFILSIFCLLFFKKQVRYLKIVTYVANMRTDLATFLTTDLAIYRGSEKIFFLLKMRVGIKWIGK